MYIANISDNFSPMYGKTTQAAQECR